MNNVIEYKEGASFLNVDKDWENKVAVGKGWSYGMEFFLQKKSGRTTGWLGYTLSWTNRQFNEGAYENRLNFGEVFPYKYDRRHDLSFTLMHKITPRMEISGTWVYGTGNAVTLPVGNFAGLQENLNPEPSPNRYYGNYLPEVRNYSKRNEYRMPAYHRMDVGISFIKPKKWGERRWVLGFYNGYSRQNPFYLDVSTDKKGNKQFKQISLFPIIPSISYNFSF